MGHDEGREEKQRIDSREPWSEKDSAIYMANKALDSPFADPDSDLCTISRQFLRAVEQLAKERKLRKELVEVLKMVNSLIDVHDLGQYIPQGNIDSVIKKGT